MDQSMKYPVTIEKYLEYTTAEYLQSENEADESFAYAFNRINKFDEEAFSMEDQKIFFMIEDLLNDILDDVDRTVLYQEEYKKIQKIHHQYPLFDLEDLIPGFALDEDIARQLCFRELLLISNVDQTVPGTSNVTKPNGVGGLCLKIELVKGKLPNKPKITEEEINSNLAQKIKDIKAEAATRFNAKHQPSSEENETQEKKLQKYKEFLYDEANRVPEKFVVHLSSEFNVDGQNAGSRIISWVDKKFHTLEERRTEYIKREDNTSNEKILYLALQENKYFVKSQEEINETRRYYSLNTTKDLVSEGANFILMRYLAIKKYEGTFELSTIYINGNMCRNIYECKGPGLGLVNGHKMELCKIYRTIIEESGIIHMSVTVMTVYGMIISHEWEGCPYIMHINPLVAITGKPVPYDFIALKRDWETNMEIMSKYLDCKVEAEFNMSTYLKDHPEIQKMMGDYLSSVLLLKPENIMPFTVDYFMNFEPYSLPQMPYFEEENEYEANDENEIFW
ncbi:hypothetical protein ABEB36_007678 [Hypothenemus hampei]|uniref:Ciliogenesis-associated TTC17-interacting protein N-terminal domain-containing protein n=1 Tax=Hypothenemus hampei TaxID=57062 RepID=A0ABD1EVE4_HYPHA